MCIVVSQNLSMGLAFRSTVVLGAWLQMVQGQKAGGKELVLFDQKYMQAWPSPAHKCLSPRKLNFPGPGVSSLSPLPAGTRNEEDDDGGGKTS